jgi:hypothetical protein
VERLCNKGVEAGSEGKQGKGVQAAQKRAQTRRKDWGLVGMENEVAETELVIKNDMMEI